MKKKFRLCDDVIAEDIISGSKLPTKRHGPKRCDNPSGERRIIANLYQRKF